MCTQPKSQTPIKWLLSKPCGQILGHLQAAKHGFVIYFYEKDFQMNKSIMN